MIMCRRAAVLGSGQFSIVGSGTPVAATPIRHDVGYVECESMILVAFSRLLSLVDNRGDWRLGTGDWGHKRNVDPFGTFSRS